MTTIISFILTAIIFVAVDMVWLAVIAKSFYWSRLGHLLTKDVVWIAVLIFYVVYVLGVFYFVINPAIATNSWLAAMQNGFLLGILCYATYDLTNMGTLKDWSWAVAVVDIIWGGILTAVTSVAGFMIASRLA